MAYSYNYGQPATYGSAPGAPPYGFAGFGEPLGPYGGDLRGSLDSGMKAPFVRGGRRRRMNIAAMMLCLFLPWVIFSVVYADMSFWIHYHQPWACYSIAAGAFLIVLWTFIQAGSIVSKKRAGDLNRESSWYIFLAATAFLAWATAMVAGDTNYFENMQPFYDLTNLNVYPGVDPSKMKGQQLMDAGRILFKEGTTVDLSRSMGFRNMDLYCVAPIVPAASSGQNATKLATYDFWAVGTNCCSGNSADFSCGEFSNPQARAGLRLMRDDQRAFFRLGVQQAEAAYGIKATHPLFFYWMQDPNAEVGAYQDEGLKYYLLGMFSYFAFQLFLVIAAALVFSRMGDF